MSTKDKNAIRNFHTLTPLEQTKRETEFLALLRQHNPTATPAQINAAMKVAIGSMKGGRP